MSMNSNGMTRRQAGALVSMIDRIVDEHDCILQIERNEVTVFAGHGDQAHAHHRGRTLYEAIAKALDTAKEYAAERRRQGWVDGDEIEVPRPAQARSKNDDAG